MRFHTLITGASNGIGKAIAEDRAKSGEHLVLVARSGDKLKALAAELRQVHGVDVQVCARDLSEQEAARQVFGFCEAQGIAVDCLINCAGFSVTGRFERMPEEELVRMSMVNMVSLATLSRLFLPAMLERRRGAVVNIASLAGFQGVAGMACYSATKAFVVTLTEALAGEFRGTGVRIFAVCPGFIDNDQFYSRAGHDRSRIVTPVSSAEVVVRAVRRGLAGNSMLVSPTRFDSLMRFTQRFVPRKLVVRLAGLFAGAHQKH